MHKIDILSFSLSVSGNFIENDTSVINSIFSNICNSILQIFSSITEWIIIFNLLYWVRRSDKNC